MANAKALWRNNGLSGSVSGSCRREFDLVDYCMFLGGCSSGIITASRTCPRAGGFARFRCINGGISLIPKKYAGLVFAFLMALIMSGIMSMVISLFNIGLVEGILTIWLKAWLPAFLVAFPTITIPEFNT